MPVTLSQEQLAASLEGIGNCGFAIPDSPELDEILESMLHHLGSPNSHLRDDLIYGTLATWISAGKLAAGTVLDILERCISNGFIAYMIDGDDQDAVFRRSFSLLVIALILERDESIKILDQTMTEIIFARVREAYRREGDVRGYIATKGWAHSVAHAADVFGLLVSRPGVSDRDIEELLLIIKAKFQNPGPYFVDNEDERTARVIGRIAECGGSRLAAILAWIPSLIVYEKPEDLELRQIVRGNVRNLLRSVYFAVDDGEIRSAVEATLRAGKWW